MPEELNQNINQNIAPEDNPDETAAVLAFGTKLSEGLLPKAPQTQETAPTSNSNQKGEETPVQEEKAPEMDLKANNKEMEKTMDSKLDKLRKEIKETIKEEISSIKDSIEDALNEDGKE